MPTKPWKRLRKKYWVHARLSSTEHTALLKIIHKTQLSSSEIIRRCLVEVAADIPQLEL